MRWLSINQANAVQLPDQHSHNSATNDIVMLVMSNVLELNCWILGDDSRRVFPVKISSSETVGYLKKAIKDEKKPKLDAITADSLDLWKVSSH